MSYSGTVLEYTGPIDYKMIDLLLMKIKTSEEFINFDKITGKRVYAVVVECLENISKHSVPKSSEIPEMQPRISVNRENNEIIITAGNPILNGTKNKLTSKINLINKLNEKELKSLYEAKINRDWKQEPLGAGLGFISMALKSKNRITFSFIPLLNGYSYFEIQIALINRS
jgi:hypothetical protein